MKSILFNTILLSFVFIFHVQAQNKKVNNMEEKAKSFEARINDVAVESKNIDNKTLENLKSTIRTALVEYYKYAHLKDFEQDGIVTQNALSKFKDLFDDNTKIVSDISKYNGIVVPFENYGSSAFDYMTAIGLDYEISSAVVDKIKEDKAGYYKAEVLVTKLMFNGLETDNSIFNCKSGRRFDLIFNYRIEKDNLNKAYISGISGNLVKDCEDAKPMWGYFGGFDYGISSASPTEFFNTQLNGLQLKKSGSIGAQLGVFYLKPLTIKEKSFLKLGLAFQYRNLSTSIDSSFYIRNSVKEIAFGGINNFSHIQAEDIRVNFEKKFVETHQAFSIAIPVGIHQKLYVNDDNTFKVSAELCVTPSFLIYSISNWAGRVSYYDSKFYFNDGNYALLPIKNSNGINSVYYGLGNNNYFKDSDKSDLSKGTKVTKPTHVKLKFQPTVWVSLSPVFQLLRGEKRAIHISPIISYSVLSFVKNNDANKYLFGGDMTEPIGAQSRINNGTESSVIEDYFKSYNLLTFGVNIGYFYKF